ncbi:MAG: NAD(P)-binding domain-containing protein, partial [Alphaproteobacteria bacterium]|nr:NAD(P)-binding domain-containing protein [Alphaproteobacteria bacterium]
DYITGFARTIKAPVRTQTTVLSVRPNDSGYRVRTDQGDWQCRAVVVASGACNIANVPALAEGVPDSVDTVTPMQYRNPDQLAEGGVLVVGASATGTQLAKEIHASSRPVTLAVGEHVRLPRLYRGRDIMWWMDAAGVLGERYDEVDDITRARRVPSSQLAGSAARTDLDLNALTDDGVRLVGKLAGIRDGKAQFSGSLANKCQLADLKMGRLLDTIDEWANENGHGSDPHARDGVEATRVEAKPPLGLDLTSGEIRTVLWATGYRADHSWLEAPVFDRKGRISHDGGVTEAPGLYVMGMQFLRRRKSALIDGAADDARELSGHLEAHLDRQSAALVRRAAEIRSAPLQEAATT